jgi:hypothetical protein
MLLLVYDIYIMVDSVCTFHLSFLGFYWWIKIYVLRVFTLMCVQVSLVLHFYFICFSECFFTKKFAKGGTSEEYLQYV